MDFIGRELGLYLGAVEVVVENCISIVEGLGYNSDNYLDSVIENRFDEISLGDNDLTNKIIAAYYEEAIGIIQEKAEKSGFSVETGYDANCDASHLFVNDQMVYDEEDVKAIFRDAAFKAMQDDPAVQNVVEVCREAMEKAGEGDETSISQLDDYVKNRMEADYEFDEYTAGNVSEAYLSETAAFVEELLKDKLGKEVSVTYDKEQLYVDGKSYFANSKDQIERD